MSILLRQRNNLVQSIFRLQNVQLVRLISETKQDISEKSTEDTTNYRANPHITNESPFKNGTLKDRLARSFGVGKVGYASLKASSIFLYEACSDKLDAVSYFEHFKLPDTLYSFFLIVQLHVWMCQARSMQEGEEGRRLRNEVVANMWKDFDERLQMIEIYSSSKRKEIMTDLLYHHQGAMHSYDEGLLTDDKTLANALWRTLFSKNNDVDPRVLELSVKYIRVQMNHIRSISALHWCTDGHFEWAPCLPYEKKIPK